MSNIILYHGSPNREICPTFGFGNDRHDYGKGFYLTEQIELAKEWSVCGPEYKVGWVHKYELKTDDLKIMDFTSVGILPWLAELMKHRNADDSKRYRILSKKFIDKFGIDTTDFDVITGWRADASYFYIAKEFVRDNVDIDILKDLLYLGGLGIQYCIKSVKAFNNLKEISEGLTEVDFQVFNSMYNKRDSNARQNMKKLINSDANKVVKVFSTLVK